MVIELYDINGKKINKLTQWDHDVKIEVRGIATDPIPEIRYSNRKSRNAMCLDAEVRDGAIWSKIPDELLQDPYIITMHICYAYPSGDTKSEYYHMLFVKASAKPNDYAYTPTEVKTWYELDERIKVLENMSRGGFVVSDTPPQDTSLLWIDTSDNA